MWDAIAKVLTNSNALLVLVFLLVFVLIFIVLIKTGLIEIKTNNVRVGKDVKERDVILQQAEYAHSYIMGIECELETDRSRYGGYLAKYVLEVINREAFNWIILNHLNLESDYISIKQEKIRSIIKRMDDVEPKFKTKEFFKRSDKWVETLIRKLVQIRQMYK